MCGLIPASKDADEAGFWRGYALAGLALAGSLSSSLSRRCGSGDLCAHGDRQRTDRFRLVAMVLRAGRDMRKVFRPLVALKG